MQRSVKSSVIHILNENLFASQKMTYTIYVQSVPDCSTTTFTKLSTVHSFQGYSIFESYPQQNIMVYGPRGIMGLPLIRNVLDICLVGIKI